MWQKHPETMAKVCARNDERRLISGFVCVQADSFATFRAFAAFLCRLKVNVTEAVTKPLNNAPRHAEIVGFDLNQEI